MPTIFLRAATLIACALAAGAPLAQTAATTPIPAGQFFKKPAMTGASISPNGRHVIVRLLSPAGRGMLTVIDAETREQKVVANFRNADVDSFYWLSDMRLGYTVTNVDHAGDIGKPGLYAVDRDGKNFEPLSEIIVGKRSFADSDHASRNYLARPTVNGFPYRKSEAVFAVARWENRDSLVRIDARNGMQTDVRAPFRTYQWLIDANGDVRVVVVRYDGKNIVSYKDGRDWRQLAAFDPLGADGFTPLVYAEGVLYVRAYNGNNESSIHRYDLEKNAITGAPTISVPGFDADGYFLVDDKKIRGFRINTDGETTVWFDPKMKAIQAEVDAALPGNVNTISYGAHSETANVLIDSYSDTQDHVYLLYSLDTKKLLRLGSAHPDLDPQRMAPMFMARYKARDGLQIPVYVSVPPAPSKKPLPTVVLVGESPWRRNVSWEWNAEVQFLASRGYVVLQPEPRGIAGFGVAHEAAGERQWGAAIQDDIADAVAWAVAQGHTDPARVCIAGTGYGGYAAMMGLIRDPERFQCGISWSGITDLEAMFKRGWEGVADARALPQLRSVIGDPRADAAWLKQISPQHNAARIRQPVLLAYGKEDVRVPFDEGRKFYEALAAGNPNAEWLAYTPSVDDWKTQHNRIDLWRRIEAFLEQHIGR